MEAEDRHLANSEFDVLNIHQIFIESQNGQNCGNYENKMLNNLNQTIIETRQNRFKFDFSYQKEILNSFKMATEKVEPSKVCIYYRNIELNYKTENVQ